MCLQSGQGDGGTICQYRDKEAKERETDREATCTAFFRSESVYTAGPNLLSLGYRVSRGSPFFHLERLRQDAHLLLALWVLGGFIKTLPCSVNKNSCRSHQSTVVTKGVMDLLLHPEISFAFDMRLKHSLTKEKGVSSRPLPICASVYYR
jgi:hypothetical protein